MGGRHRTGLRAAWIPIAHEFTSDSEPLPAPISSARDSGMAPPGARALLLPTRNSNLNRKEMTMTLNMTVKKTLSMLMLGALALGALPLSASASTPNATAKPSGHVKVIQHRKGGKLRKVALRARRKSRSRKARSRKAAPKAIPAQIG